MRDITEDIKLHSLAHDIRGMLAPAQLVVDALLDYDDRFVAASSERIQDVVNRITMYCSDALARPKDIFGETPLLSDIVSDVLNVSKPLSIKHGIRLQTKIENHPLSISSAATVHRIIMNLTLNALEALAESEGSMLTIRSHMCRRYFHIDIIDNGPGLPESVIGLFLPHQLGRESRSTLPRGLGLVSAIWSARSIGGQLLMLRTGPDGTAFRLTLP